MSERALEAGTHRQDGVTVIDLHGDIDGSAETALNEAYERAGAGADTVVLDFANVGYINSTGIALIVGVLAEARKTHRTVLACGLSDHYREIFQVTRLADFMPMYTNEEEAVRGAAAPAGA